MRLLQLAVSRHQLRFVLLAVLLLVDRRRAFGTGRSRWRLRRSVNQGIRVKTTNHTILRLRMGSEDRLLALAAMKLRMIAPTTTAA
jgi:hypothetical protein